LFTSRQLSDRRHLLDGRSRHVQAWAPACRRALDCATTSSSFSCAGQHTDAAQLGERWHFRAEARPPP